METFATLKPLNIAAARCVDRVCEAVELYPSEYRHHTRFLRYLPKKVSLRQALNLAQRSPRAPRPASDVSFSSEGTVPDEEPLNALVWCGWYTFAIKDHPELVRLGWRGGYGRKWESDFAGRVDLLLALTADAKENRLHGNHIIFNFMEHSGAFAIRSVHDDRTTSVDTQHIDPQDKWSVLSRPEHIITVGELQYLFSYAVSPEHEVLFQIAKAQYLREKLRWDDPIASVSSTPTDCNVRIGNWTLLKTAGAGTDAVVKAAIASDGQLVAVRQVKRRKDNDSGSREIASHQELDSRIGSRAGADFVTRLSRVIHTNQHAPSEDFLFLKPLARMDLSQMLMSSSQTITVRLQVFVQAVYGVEAIHNAGYIHCDIKPKNIGIVSMNPPHAVILDYGNVVDIHQQPYGRAKATPGVGGTLGYLAPEREVEGGVYRQAADVWSLGCVGVHLFLEQHRTQLPWGHDFNPWRTNVPRDRSLVEERKKRHSDLQTSLENNKTTSIQHLLGTMLRFPERQRPSVQEARCHPSLSQPLNSLSMEDRR